MTTKEYQNAMDRAEENGLITIPRSGALTCRDCGHSTKEAFTVGPCPNCGSARTANTPGAEPT
jgi:rubrerythrin